MFLANRRSRLFWGMLVVTLFSLAFLFVPTALAQESPPELPAVETTPLLESVAAGVLGFLETILPNLLLFVALCILDVGLGIAAAVKRRRFEWGKVADFYATNVLAYLMGWILFASFGAFAIDKMQFLGEFQYLASAGFIWVTWGFLAAALVASIGNNFKEIYGRDLSPGLADERYTLTQAYLDRQEKERSG